MGLPVDKLVGNSSPSRRSGSCIKTYVVLVATNENDILYRFWQTGRYEKQPVLGKEAEGGMKADGVKAHEEGCKETLSPAMDILVSSNFERLMWFLAKGTHPSPGCTYEVKLPSHVGNIRSSFDIDE